MALIQTKGVAHFTIPCADTRVSEKFYTEVLGMKSIRGNHDRGMIFLDCGGDCIVLLRVDKPISTATVRDCHTAFIVDSDAYAEAVKTLQAADNIEYLYEEDMQGGAVNGPRAYFHDPDGNVLEIIDLTGYLGDEINAKDATAELMTTTVEVLVDAFNEAGTPFIVGHPGGESVEMMDAARKAGMRFIFIKQETAGAMLASTWGEITGSPGVCLSTRGPGASNMVNGVTHAFLDRCPLIAITDSYPAHTYEVGLRQRIDQQALYAPITKWHATIGAKTVRQQVRRAMRVATSGTPGPVQFDLPADQTTREAETLIAEPPLRPDMIAVAPERDAMKRPIAMLDGARRPILLVGAGLLWGRASEAMVALAEALGAPVLTTTKAKGAIPEDHPLSAGALIGGIIERDLINRADLIVAVGLDAVELQPKPWPYTAPVLSLAGTPSLDALVPASPEVVGDLNALLSGLAGWAKGGQDWGAAAARDYRAKLNAALDVPANGLTPQAALEVSRAVLPRGTVVSCDAGASRMLVVQKWGAYAPREFLACNGLGSMGFAVPGALGARLAYPDRPVVAFTGDGGLLMAVAELQTAVAEKLPIIVVVFDDAEIGLIRVKQQIKQVRPYGVHLGGMDWEKLAQGFGADGVTVDTEKGLGDALTEALRTGRTTLIGARIDGSGYVEQFNALREL